jgi:hypothetical protein
MKTYTDDETIGEVVRRLSGKRLRQQATDRLRWWLDQGWRELTHMCLVGLLEGQCLGTVGDEEFEWRLFTKGLHPGVRYGRSVSRWLDHHRWWYRRRPTEQFVLTSEPYEWGEEPDDPRPVDMELWCTSVSSRQRRITWAVLPDRSWHYPGYTTLVVIGERRTLADILKAARCESHASSSLLTPVTGTS